ncbi:hypothetical protein NDU88_000849 [Pleurodeles waltl]|uniref:Uncharacterized protein n=1 Tax=Pleurodeles waltl TaxID=8319 RepID=A0AAV7L9D3_PLEWA|nr:hypothetical protein NDU88_000849 [Pleurodeles waltl]
MCNSGSMLSSVLVECIEVSVFPFVVCFRRVFIGGAPAPDEVADWKVKSNLHLLRYLGTQLPKVANIDTYLQESGESSC